MSAKGSVDGLDRSITPAPGRAGQMARAAQERARARALLDAEDERAMLAFRAGDRGAFAVVVRRHQRGLYNFAFDMLGGRSAAEDATQEILLKVVRSVDRWKPEARVATWLYAIARNHCIDELRKSKLRKTESLDRPLRRGDDEGSTVVDHLADDRAIGTDREAARGHMRASLLGAIASLPDEQREVFVMREQVGLPFKEIAEIVGVPENTAKSRMRYALQGLRAALEQDGISPEDAKP